MEHFQITVNANPDYRVTRKTVDGTDYVVVPVAMMAEGVHNGSGGRVYHHPDKFGANARHWNGVPAVTEHPQDENNTYVSANSPKHAGITIGTVYNAYFDKASKKLRAEVWMPAERLEGGSPGINAAIAAHQPIDVSIGKSIFPPRK